MKIRYKIALIHMLHATLALSLMSACSKMVTPFIPIFMIVFYRSLFGFICLIPYACRFPHRIRGYSKHDWSIIALRCLSGFLALGCFFYAVSQLELATAIILNYTSPIFIALLSSYFLKEHIHIWQICLTLLALLGVYIVIEPYLHFQLWPALIGVLSGFLTAIAYVSIRFLSGSVTNQSIVFYFTGFSTFAALLVLLPDWSWPPFQTWLPLLGVGLLAYIGQIKLTSAFLKAPAPLVSHFGYFNIVFAALWGWLFWQEAITGHFLLGTGIIVATGFLVRWRYGATSSS
jgi:drug/metabolite transporter (DMT)-like permease